MTGETANTVARRRIEQAELDAICNRVANAFIARGVQPGDRVAILSRNSSSFVAIRFALARIDGDVDFSVYGPVDRVFTLVAGEGLTLDFGAGKVIEVDAVNVPHAYACDVPLHCRVKGRGPALALNLFTARGRWNAEVDVVALKGGTEVPLSCNAAVLLALEGDCEISRSGERLHLREGDAAEVRGQSELVASGGGYLYVGRLTLMSA